MSNVFVLTFNLARRTELFGLVKSTVQSYLERGLCFAGVQEISQASCAARDGDRPSTSSRRGQVKLEFYQHGDCAILFKLGEPVTHEFDTGHSMIGAVIHSEGSQRIGFINSHRNPNMSESNVKIYFLYLLGVVCRMFHGGTDNDFKYWNPVNYVILVGDLNADIDRAETAAYILLYNLVKELNLNVFPTEATYFTKENKAHRYDYIIHSTNVLFSNSPIELQTTISDHKPH